MRSTYIFLIELPSNHPRFIKIYSITFLLKNQHPENAWLPQNQLKMVLLTIGRCIAQNDLKL